MSKKPCECVTVECDYCAVRKAEKRNADYQWYAYKNAGGYCHRRVLIHEIMHGQAKLKTSTYVANEYSCPCGGYDYWA